MTDIEKYLTNDRIFQYKVIDTDRIPFSESVVEACRANLCGRYGTCWTCPPGVGPLSELEKKVRRYKRAAVFTCKYELEDWYDIEGMADGAKTTQELLLRITYELRRDGVDFYALGCEGCRICEKCTYPDKPCRFPDKAIVSVEACGINVVELSADIGLKYNNGPNTVTYFCAVLFG